MYRVVVVVVGTAVVVVGLGATMVLVTAGLEAAIVVVVTATDGDVGARTVTSVTTVVDAVDTSVVAEDGTDARTCRGNDRADGSATIRDGLSHVDGDDPGGGAVTS
jgi:hypothetical protein